MWDVCAPTRYDDDKAMEIPTPSSFETTSAGIASAARRSTATRSESRCHFTSAATRSALAPQYASAPNAARGTSLESIGGHRKEIVHVGADRIQNDHRDYGGQGDEKRVLDKCLPGLSHPRNAQR